MARRVSIAQSSFDKVAETGWTGSNKSLLCVYICYRWLDYTSYKSCSTKIKFQEVLTPLTETSHQHVNSLNISLIKINRQSGLHKGLHSLIIYLWMDVCLLNVVLGAWKQRTEVSMRGIVIYPFASWTLKYTYLSVHVFSISVCVDSTSLVFLQSPVSLIFWLLSGEWSLMGAVHRKCCCSWCVQRVKVLLRKLCLHFVGFNISERFRTLTLYTPKREIMSASWKHYWTV